MVDVPYFITNDEWYTFDFKKKEYQLTDNATQEAKASYEEYMQMMRKAQAKGMAI